MLGEEFGDEVEVADVALDENVARVALQGGEVLEVAGVGQRVEIDDRLIGLGQPVEDEVAADEAGSAGDEDRVHWISVRILRKLAKRGSPPAVRSW